MNRKIFVMISIAAIAACAKNTQSLSDVDDRDLRYHYAWSRTGGNEVEFSKELYECETGVEQRYLASTQAMNQYKYSRMNMGVAGFGLEEPEEIEEEALPKMLNRCLEGHGWKVAKKTPFKIASYQYADEAKDTHVFQRK